MDVESNDVNEVDLDKLHGKRFESREELFEDVRVSFASKGYAISIKNSKKEEYVTIGCDRGGVYRDKYKNTPANRKRKTSTRLTNCPFKVQGKKKSDGRWTLELINISHNHDASIDMSGHPSCRRLTKIETSEVERMTIAVYNTKKKIRSDKLDGRSMIETLFEEFGQAKFFYNYKRDESGRLTHVFFAHPKSVMLSKTYKKVYVVDCTYKTNSYKMPLLDIVGVSGSNKSFYSCFVFLKNERVENYISALQMFREMIGPTFQPLVLVSDSDKALAKAISVVFPLTAHLLCIWHIQKNVVAKCKSQFAEDDDWDMFLSTWNALMYAETEVSFEETWVLLEHLYSEKETVIAYLKETWLPHKHKFVTAWTDRFPHFGNRVSSRAEGAHAKLKGYLKVSTGDLAQVVSKICLAVENEYQEINASLESERIRVPNRCRILQFKFLINCVSHFALSHLYKQYEMFKFGTLKADCSGNFVASMGLPCAHMISRLKESSLSLNSIDSQWRIDTIKLTSPCNVGKQSEDIGLTMLWNKLESKYLETSVTERKAIEENLVLMLNAPAPVILEPNIQISKGRPQGSGNKRKEPANSTKRDYSEFEIVEASLARKNKKTPQTD